MASDGSAVPSGPEEEQREGGPHLTPSSLTDSPGPEAGVPADNQKASGESAECDEDGVKVCQFFLMGKCHFGQRCRLSHSDPSADDSGAACPDSDDKQDGERTEKHKKKKKGGASKAAKPKHSERREVNKKPRMRTADDVISRILWDPSVDAAEFVVGYVDRFLGILERPFSDFNWDTDPCDCDYASELALPRHRIQYFTYRGHRVWDRHTRTDRVFGSTGQPLAPPFGREEEVTEEINCEDPEEAEQLPAAGTEQDGTEAEFIHTESKHLEEEKTDPKDPKQPEEAADSLQASDEQRDVKEDEEEAPAEWEESAANNGDAESPSAPLEQREEKRGGRPPKKRPTHFITFRANTPSILSCFQQLQEELVALLPDSAPHWHAASSLHVTLCLLVLRGPAEVAAAGEILRRFAQLDRNPPVAVTFPVKLKHFNGKVLYLSPQPQLHLQQLNSGLQEAFRTEGWLHRDSYNPRYHLTLAKLDDPEADRMFEGVADLKAGKSLNFGRLPVNTLHLCAMGGAKVDGFYEILCTVTLR